MNQQKGRNKMLKVKDVKYLLDNEYVTSVDIGIKRRFSNNHDWVLAEKPHVLFNLYAEYNVLSIEPTYGGYGTLDIIIQLPEGND